MDMWLLSLLFYHCLIYFIILPDNLHGQLCRVSNIQIDNEEGKQQYIELNLKKVDADDEFSCPGCYLHENSQAGGFNGYSWISSPPTFSLVVTPGEIFIECESEDHQALPLGLCAKTEPHKVICVDDICRLEDIEELAEVIGENQFLPFTTGDDILDYQIILGIVLLNVGNIDKSIEKFTSVINVDSQATMAYIGRGAAYARKGLHNMSVAQKALNDFSKAISLDTGQTRPDIYTHKAEVLLMMHMFDEAYDDATMAIKIKPSAKIYFLRGVISLLMENFAYAEQDFRKNLQTSDENIRSLSHFHLGLALYYRGKVRNAVEVFKEVLKENPNHLGATLSLAQGFKELSNVRGALVKFNQSLQIQPNSTLAFSLRGNLMFNMGDHQAAIADYDKCLSGDPHHPNCLYMRGASKILLGQIYEGLKDTTKLMVSDLPVMKASPEQVKSHYLREYARYIHTHLDGPISSMQPEKDFSPDYLDHWVNLKKFDLKNYKEQPGLQPEIRDVSSPESISPDLQSLICQAEALGRLSQVSVDGIVPDKRLNIAMGLASIHVAQYFEAKWKILKTKTGTQDKVVSSWRDLFNIAVNYRRLASLDLPIFWVDQLLDYANKDGYKIHIPFIRGSVQNIKMTPYFDLSFKLAKTMLEHYSGEGAVNYSSLKEDISKATSCEDLLAVAKKRQINPQGFLVSTQVPSVLRVKEDYRLDGGVLVLTENKQKKLVFALNIANTAERMSSYYAEMDHLLALLQDEIRKSGINKASDVEILVTQILSIVYYFYNLIPLSRGTSAVAYSVLLGLIMSVGRQITGRIPNGRLLDMEALLAGAPDAFVLVAKNWMQIKKIHVPLSSLPKVSELLPTVRSVLEVLSVNATSC